MIHCEPTKRGDQVKVTFTLADGEASGAVAVVGDFNGWNPGANPMKRKHGTTASSLTLVLSAGRTYRFRYLTEGGRWFNDAEADGYERNDFGGENSVIDLTDAGSGQEP